MVLVVRTLFPYFLSLHYWPYVVTSILVFLFVVVSRSPDRLDSCVEVLQLPYLVADLVAFNKCSIAHGSPGMSQSTLSSFVLNVSTLLMPCKFLSFDGNELNVFGALIWNRLCFWVLHLALILVGIDSPSISQTLVQSMYFNVKY